MHTPAVGLYKSLGIIDAARSLLALSMQRSGDVPGQPRQVVRAGRQPESRLLPRHLGGSPQGPQAPPGHRPRADKGGCRHLQRGIRQRGPAVSFRAAILGHASAPRVSGTALLSIYPGSGGRLAHTRGRSLRPWRVAAFALTGPSAGLPPSDSGTAGGGTWASCWATATWPSSPVQTITRVRVYLPASSGWLRVHRAVPHSG